jgi:hypothetical protein
MLPPLRLLSAPSPRERAIQRAIDGEGADAARLAAAFRADDPDIDRLAARLEDLDHRLADRLAGAPVDDTLLARIQAAIPDGRPPAHARLPFAWIGAALAAALLVGLGPMTDLRSLDRLGLLAWLTMALTVGASLLLAALLPVGLLRHRVGQMFRAYIPLGPVERLTCATAGGLLVIVAWLVA